VGSVLVAAGCAQPVPVAAAPAAADPRCATVMLGLPERLGDMPRLTTSSQATVAWGARADPVVLRCGVDPPGPSTDQCVTADDGRTAVDWLAVPGEEDADGSAPWTFTTYGRSPAVEVHVPAAVTATRSTSFLVELGPAVSRVEQTRSCVGIGDL
jgi:hypothetical protein